MLPLNARGVGYTRATRVSLPASVPEYLCRVLDFRSMDFEATLDQMLTLASSDPGRVYKTNFYRKQMKNQWARDDPAFAVAQVLLLSVVAVAYALAFRPHPVLRGGGLVPVRLRGGHHRLVRREQVPAAESLALGGAESGVAVCLRYPLQRLLPPLPARPRAAVLPAADPAAQGLPEHDPKQSAVRRGLFRVLLHHAPGLPRAAVPHQDRGVLVSDRRGGAGLRALPVYRAAGSADQCDEVLPVLLLLRGETLKKNRSHSRSFAVSRLFFAFCLFFAFSVFCSHRQSKRTTIRLRGRKTKSNDGLLATADDMTWELLVGTSQLLHILRGAHAAEVQVFACDTLEQITHVVRYRLKVARRVVRTANKHAVVLPGAERLERVRHGVEALHDRPEQADAGL
eukprot:scaffold143_cov260-Pinguiococcus_pyrenoidosus.AAC.2